MPTHTFCLGMCDHQHAWPLPPSPRAQAVRLPFPPEPSPPLAVCSICAHVRHLLTCPPLAVAHTGQGASASHANSKKLRLCEDLKKGVVCSNLTETVVQKPDDAMNLLQRGITNRQTAATLCNKNSSRSHSIFTVKIMVKEITHDGEEQIRYGQLNLVDLAGSECVARSGAKGQRSREAGNINQSLLTLGRVIVSLVDHHGHVPYRKSANPYPCVV